MNNEKSVPFTIIVPKKQPIIELTQVHHLLRYVDKRIGTPLFPLEVLAQPATPGTYKLRTQLIPGRFKAGTVLPTTGEKYANFHMMVLFVKKHWETVISHNMGYSLLCLGTHWEAAGEKFFPAFRLDNRENDGHTELIIVPGDQLIHGFHTLYTAD